MSLYRPTSAIQAAFTNQLDIRRNVGSCSLGEESIQGKKAMSAKSFLLTCAILCGGYVSNTLLDNALEAAETYFHLQTSTYKTDSNGYIICSTEKPK
jgi:hypothetical protein